MNYIWQLISAISLTLAVFCFIVTYNKSKQCITMLSRIKTRFRNAVLSNPFDAIEAFNQVVDDLDLETSYLEPVAKTGVKYIAYIYNANNDNIYDEFVFELSNSNDIDSVMDIFTRLETFTGKKFSFYIREYKTVPSHVHLNDKSLADIDPYDPTLDAETKRRIMVESQNNKSYYFTMVHSNPVGPMSKYQSEIIEMLSNTSENNRLTEAKSRNARNIEFELGVAQRYTAEQIDIILKAASSSNHTGKISKAMAEKYLWRPESIIPKSLLQKYNTNDRKRIVEGARRFNAIPKNEENCEFLRHSTIMTEDALIDLTPKQVDKIENLYSKNLINESDIPLSYNQCIDLINLSKINSVK